MLKDRTYVVVTGDGGELTSGVSATEIESVAQAHANRLGETVYYSAIDGNDHDGIDDEDPGTAVEPEQCECQSCGCTAAPTTKDDGGNHVCDACAEYATSEDGDTYCSRCDEYVDDGEFSGGGMHGGGTAWMSRPRVRGTGDAT